MPCTFSRLTCWLAVFAALLLSAPAPATAQSCTKDDISRTIDSTAAALRKLNAAHQPELQAKLRQLGELRGWSESEQPTKAAAYIQDDETRALDEQAGRLLLELEVLGDESAIDKETCLARLEKLKKISAQLIEITTAKAAHVSAKVDAALNAGTAPKRAAEQPAPKAPPKVAARRDPAASQPPPAQPSPPVRELEQPPVPPPASSGGGWETDTMANLSPGNERMPAPEALSALPPRLQQPEDLEFTADEIRDAGRGFFGSLSAELAAVIEYAFRSYGRPNGYVLGSEGGAALLAGLRYGDGRLVTKRGEQKVYWQGPSLGYDVGLAGSRVMFLVYNLEQPNDLFARFVGVDGSAYIVGGVGMTFLKKGSVVLAPIRTGLGLRVGANVGYLKFTPEPSINPF
jgi:hypothetical protein